MHSKKEYEVKIKQLKKEYELKIRKLEKMLEKKEGKCILLKKTLSEVRQLNKRLTQRIKEVTKGRDDWKSKHRDKQKVIKSLKAKIPKEEKVARHHYGQSLIRLCVLLRVIGGCSYVGIVRVLRVLMMCSLLDLCKVPCANTVQNWVSKAGLEALKNAVNEPISIEVTVILDECIRKGKEKQLIVLLVPFEKANDQALRFEDVQVVYMEGATSWKGKEIEKTLSFLMNSEQLKVRNVLSDEGNNLVNFSNLSQQQHIPDIGHGIATCLKKTFLQDPDYKSFITLTSSYTSKGVNQDLSYLCPPKLGRKARFMNQDDIVDWAKILTERIGELDEKSKAFFKQLPEHSSMINHLASCLDLAQRIAKPLKQKGANKETLAAAKELIAAGEKQGGYVKTFVTYLSKYINIYEKFVSKDDVKNIHVSSDIIESLFGKYKHIANHSALTGLTKLNLELVTYCMNPNKLFSMIPTALESVYMTDLEEWVDDHSSENQLVKRKNFFKKLAKKTKKTQF